MSAGVLSAPLFRRAVRERVTSASIAVAILGLWLLAAMAIYRDIDLGLYTDLPESIRGLMGIPEEADTATLAYNVLFSFAGALTIAGLAVSWGGSAIAGDERDGTAGALFAQPVSRRQVLISRLAASATVIVAATAAAWIAARLAPVVLGVDIGSVRVDAMIFHLGANALFWGAASSAVGASTGRARIAGTSTGAAMALSYIVAGLFPLVSGLSGMARLSPWYYFDGSDPLANGISVRHLGVLGCGTVVCVVAGAVALERRDLRSGESTTRLLDVLRTRRLTGRAAEVLAGRARVSRLWLRVGSEHQGLLVITAFVMFAVMGVAMGPMYAAVDDRLASFTAEVPEQVIALAGGGDLGSPEGWFRAETFSLMAPAALITVTVIVAARSLATEERRGTLGLLLAGPVSRTRVVLHFAAAMLVHAVAIAVVTAAGVISGSAIAGLGLSAANVIWTTLLALALGLLFGAVALAIVAATGSVRLATWATAALAVTSHLLNAFLPLSDRWATWAEWTPHHYYLGGDPLSTGLDVGNLAVLMGLLGAAVAVAVVSFERRDLA